MPINPNHPGFDPALSKAYDPNYQPSKALSQLVAENPANQFLADRLAEEHADLKTNAAAQDNKSPGSKEPPQV
jgi:hypothetical protein